ncbi:hypothetical protein EVAR_24173_1 [Eumeta japonica]|uniref:Uncharacterized protein n=1 Tax=Eumeta variegata TaxID=151549 RepID=A0A4C1W507_EUMVA|nr:hypothetical protein EVAR_24173_1 [Eumeta japonica]
MQKCNRTAVPHKPASLSRRDVAVLHRSGAGACSVFVVGLGARGRRTERAAHTQIRMRLDLVEMHYLFRESSLCTREQDGVRGTPWYPFTFWTESEIGRQTSRSGIELKRIFSLGRRPAAGAPSRSGGGGGGYIKVFVALLPVAAHSLLVILFIRVRIRYHYLFLKTTTVVTDRAHANRTPNSPFLLFADRLTIYRNGVSPTWVVEMTNPFETSRSFEGLPHPICGCGYGTGDLLYARASSRRGYDPDGPVVRASFQGSKLENFPRQPEIKRSCQWVHRYRPRPSRPSI